MLLKSDLEYEIDYGHSESDVFDHVWLFGNAGSVGTQPTTIPDLMGTMDLTVYYPANAEQEKLGLVGDGALKLWDGNTTYPAYTGAQTNLVLGIQPTDTNFKVDTGNNGLTVYLDFEIYGSNGVDQMLYDGLGIFIYYENSTKQLVVYHTPGGETTNTVTFKATYDLDLNPSRVRLVYNYDRANTLSQLYINGKFVDEMTPYTWTYQGSPFATVYSIKTSDVVLGKYSVNNGYRFNGHLNMVAIGYMRNKTGNTTALRAMTTEDYPMILRKLPRDEYCLMFDSTKSSFVKLSGIVPTSNPDSGYYQWFIEFEARTADSSTIFRVLERNGNCVTLNGSTNQLLIQTSSSTLTFNLPVDAVDFHKYKIFTKDGSYYLQVDDVAVGTGGTLSGFTNGQMFMATDPYIGKYEVTTPYYYSGAVKYIKFVDFNNGVNSRFWDFRVPMYSTTIKDKFSGADAVLTNLVNPYIGLEAKESDGLQFDGSVYCRIPVWTATDDAEIVVKFYRPNPVSVVQAILGDSTNGETRFYIDASGYVSGRLGGANLPETSVSPTYIPTNGILHTATLSRPSAGGICTLTIVRESDGLTTVYTNDDGINTDNVVIDYIGRTLGFANRYAGKIVSVSLTTLDGADDRFYDFSDIEYGRVAETVQGKIGYLRDTNATLAAANEYNTVKESRITGIKGLAGTNYLGLQTSWSATGAFKISGSIVYPDAVTPTVSEHLWSSYNDLVNAIELLTNGRLFVYLRDGSEVVSSSSQADLDIANPGVAVDFVITRDEANLVTLIINGEVHDTGTKAGTINVTQLGRFSTAGGYDDKFRSRVIGTWELDNYAGDRRLYDFTKANAGKVVEINNSIDALIYNGSSTYGFQQVVAKNYFLVGQRATNMAEIGFVYDNGSYKGYEFDSSTHILLDSYKTLAVNDTLTISGELTTTTATQMLLGTEDGDCHVWISNSNTFFMRLQNVTYSVAGITYPGIGVPFQITIARNSTDYVINSTALNMTNSVITSANALDFIYIGKSNTGGSTKLEAILYEVSMSNYGISFTDYPLVDTSGNGASSTIVGRSIDQLDYTTIQGFDTGRGGDTYHSIAILRGDTADTGTVNFISGSTRFVNGFSIIADKGYEVDFSNLSKKNTAKIPHKLLIRNIPAYIEGVYLGGDGTTSIASNNSVVSKCYLEDNFHETGDAPVNGEYKDIRFYDSIIEGGVYAGVATNTGMSTLVQNCIVRGNLNANAGDNPNITFVNSILDFSSVSLGTGAELYLYNCVTPAASVTGVTDEEGVQYSVANSLWANNSIVVADQDSTFKYKGINNTNIAPEFYTVSSTAINLLQFGGVAPSDVVYCDGTGTLVPITLTCGDVVLWQS